MNLALSWVEEGFVPDPVVRSGIRRLCAQRLGELGLDDIEGAAALSEAFVRQMRLSGTALAPQVANRQHYEVPADFFGLALGPHRKYSCAYWPPGVDDLESAERLALATTCTRADIADGHSILELGCGWGSLTLWMAEHFPGSHVVGVSNSRSQREYILGQAAERGLGNVEIVTADMNHFRPRRQFDRVVSVEMFEHMRNWESLFRSVRHWLAPGGRFFLHVFCHRLVPYAFVERDATDWMSRHFFTGGMMPSDDLALRCRGPLVPVERWRWDGRHYEKTANAWLARLDARRDEALAILRGAHGADAELWLQRWRLFFMACAELFGYREGREWWVSHYLFEHASP